MAESQAEISGIREILQTQFKRPFHSEADVLFVCDTDCFYYLAATPQGDPLTGNFAVNQASAAASYSGAVIAMVHLCDLERVDWKRYRAVIFGNTLLLTPRQQDFVRKVLARDGRYLIWIYAPGYTDGSVLHREFITEVTGINVAPAILTLPPQIHVEGPGLPQARWGVDSRIEPLFIVQHDAVTPVGRLQETGQVALARKPSDGGTSWLCSLPITNPDILRFIFKSAGAHIYSDSGDVVHCGGGILAVHTLTGGERRLALKNGKVVKTALQPRSTVLFDSESGQELLR
jgi:hypothetical protein